MVRRDSTRGRAKKTPALLTTPKSPAAASAGLSHPPRTPLTELRGWHRCRDEEALSSRESDPGQEIPRLLVLDTDSCRLDPAAAGCADDGTDVFERAMVPAHARHEAT